MQNIQSKNGSKSLLHLHQKNQWETPHDEPQHKV